MREKNGIYLDFKETRFVLFLLFFLTFFSFCFIFCFHRLDRLASTTKEATTLSERAGGKKQPILNPVRNVLQYSFDFALVGELYLKR